MPWHNSASFQDNYDNNSKFKHKKGPHCDNTLPPQKESCQ